MSTKEIVTSFYDCFAKGEAKGMLNFYAEEVIFCDPAFGKLSGNRPHEMWRMLLGRFDEHTTINFEVVETEANKAQVKWTAKYHFGKKRRPVTNRVTSTLILKNEKIVEYYDNFDIWKWAYQAIGIGGLLLGWSKFFQLKIQQNTNKMLDKYIAKHA